VTIVVDANLVVVLATRDPRAAGDALTDRCMEK